MLKSMIAALESRKKRVQIFNNFFSKVRISNFFTPICFKVTLRLKTKREDEDGNTHLNTHLKTSRSAV